MAKENKENGQEAPPSRFRKIVTERYMFNAEKCYAQLPAAKRLPLVGFLVNVLDMPPIREREWKAYVIHTTEPVNALDREKKVIELPVGSLVLVPATHQLSQFLGKAAHNPTSVFEVSIRPDKKIDIGAGQSMWIYDLAANSKAFPRAKFGVAGLLNAGDAMAGETPALPAAGSAAQGQETGTGDDEIPF